jgi:hypothetical protein
MGALPYPGDQIIDADMARSLHAGASRDHVAVAWAVLWDLPAYPEQYAARLVTSGAAPSPYLLLADSLAEIQALLPPGLVRSERQPGDPPAVVAIWLAGSRRTGPGETAAAASPSSCMRPVRLSRTENRHKTIQKSYAEVRNRNPT